MRFVEQASTDLQEVNRQAFDTIALLRDRRIERNDAATISSLLGRVVAANGTELKVHLAAARLGSSAVAAAAGPAALAEQYQEVAPAPAAPASSGSPPRDSAREPAGK